MSKKIQAIREYVEQDDGWPKSVRLGTLTDEARYLYLNDAQERRRAEAVLKDPEATEVAFVQEDSRANICRIAGNEDCA